MRRAIVLLILVVFAGNLRAGEPPGVAEPGFVPTELYRYETLTLPNGFRVVLNPRQVSRSVSFRLVVDVGLLDFECRDRELPHLAEHLMFGGPGDLTESDLDAMVNALGGEWNAYTHSWKTEYQLDIYSGHALEGLDILYRMFTGTEVTSQKLDSARGVLNAESGGEAGLVRDLLYRWGFGDGAVGESYRRFVPESRAFCAHVPQTGHFTVADLDDFLRTHYQPHAMLLVAVGDFDPAALRAGLEAGFGAIPSTGAGQPPRAQPALAAVAKRYRTSLNPLLGNTAHVTIDLMVGYPEPLSEDLFALQQIADHLDARLYEEIRVNRGLAYTPMASLVDQGDFMTLLLEAEVDPSRTDEVVGIMRDVVTEVATAGIDAESLAAQRQGTLYRLAANLDRNASFSGIYVDLSRQLARGERVPDIEAAISAYTADEMRERAAEWLSLDRALVYEAAPTLTYPALGWMLVLATAAGGAAGWRIALRRRARRRGHD